MTFQGTANTLVRKLDVLIPQGILCASHSRADGCGIRVERERARERAERERDRERERERDRERDGFSLVGFMVGIRV